MTSFCRSLSAMEVKLKTLPNSDKIKCKLVHLVQPIWSRDYRWRCFWLWSPPLALVCCYHGNEHMTCRWTLNHRQEVGIYQPLVNVSSNSEQKKPKEASNSQLSLEKLSKLFPTNAFLLITCCDTNLFLRPTTRTISPWQIFLNCSIMWPLTSSLHNSAWIKSCSWTPRAS